MYKYTPEPKLISLGYTVRLRHAYNHAEAELENYGMIAIIERAPQEVLAVRGVMFATMLASGPGKSS